jgi:hypothetical protein
MIKLLFFKNQDYKLALKCSPEAIAGQVVTCNLTFLTQNPQDLVYLTTNMSDDVLRVQYLLKVPISGGNF